MVYWLMVKPNIGEKDRGESFWKDHLRDAGITDVRTCDLEDTRWVSDVSPSDLVLAAGGDGSVNRAARICLDREATLAVLPSGTANDFARNLKLPEDPAELCQLIARQPTQDLDVAEAGDQLYLNVAHVGLGTLPSREAAPGAKRYLGRFSYLATLLRKLLAQRGFHASIKSEQGQVQGRWLSIAVATGAYFGGGNEIPEASANDGQLDILAVRPRPFVQLLLTMLTVRASRRSPRRTSTLVHLKSRWCQVHTHRPKTVTMDGDVAGKTPLDVTCRAGCLRVVCETVVTTSPPS